MKTPSRSGELASVELETQAATGTPLKPSTEDSEKPLLTVPETSLERQQASLRDQPLNVDKLLHEDSAAEKTVFYLAYGSNLCAKTFRETRRITPISQVNVLVPDLALTFDLPGVPYLEPCFAATQYRDEKTGWALYPGQDSAIFHHVDEQWRKPLVGVVYEVSLADYARIIATEGAGSSYIDELVDCYPFPSNFDPRDPVPDTPTTQRFRAHTLLAPRAKDDSPTSGKKPQRSRPDPTYACPSPRYKNLLVTGAQEHDLPLEYRNYLASVEAYRATTFRQRMGKVVFVMVWGVPVMTLMVLGTALANDKGKAPGWMARCQVQIFAWIWVSYDNFFKKIFGDGERTIKSDGGTGNIKLN